jgi:hypothetical protein
MYTYINIYSHICRRPVNRWDLTEAAHGFISTVLYALETGEGLPSLIAGKIYTYEYIYTICMCIHVH